MTIREVTATVLHCPPSLPLHHPPLRHPKPSTGSDLYITKWRNDFQGRQRRSCGRWTRRSFLRSRNSLSDGHAAICSPWQLPPFVVGRRPNVSKELQSSPDIVTGRVGYGFSNSLPGITPVAHTRTQVKPTFFSKFISR